MRRALFALFLVACGAAKPEPVKPPPPHAVVVAPPRPAVVAPVIAKASKVRTVEGITEYALPNGLSILLFPDPTQSTVTVNVTYLVGSRQEGYGETGMAHLIEHMMFKGTRKLRDLSKLMDARGAQNNASTSYDRTNYFETFPATQENVDWALDLEADRMVNSTFLESDLASEMSVVRNEFEAGENNPEGILVERILSTAYLWHNYGKSTIGSRADIERVPASTLRTFYQKYYQPDDAVLLVAGKFDAAAALATIEQKFGVLPKPTRGLPPTYSVEPVQDGERDVTLRRAGDVSVVGVAYHVVAGTSPDFPAVEAALDILTRQPSGRLYKSLVATKLAASVSGFAFSGHDPFAAMIFADIRDAKNVDQVEKSMLAEIEGFANSTIDEKDLERWRASTIKELELAMADSRNLALRLSEFIALGDWRTLFAYRERVKKVTVDDVTRVAKAYFRASNRTSGRFVPSKDIERAPLTEAPAIENIVRGIDGGEVKEQGEAFASTIENIEAHTQRTSLPAGIEAAYLPKKTRGGKVQLELHLHFGNAKDLQGKGPIGDMMGAMLMRGTAKKSFQELQDLEDRLKAQISISGDATSVTLHIETLRDQLAPALELAAEELTTASFPDKEFELVRQEQLVALEQQLQDPSSLAQTALQQHMTRWPKADPRYPMSVPEQIAAIKQITVGQVRAFYKDFVGAGHGELAAVGDFDPAAVSAQIGKSFGAWLGKKPYARLEDKVFGVPGATLSIDVKDKENSTIVFAHDLAMKDTDADYPAWLMVGQILGGDEGSRLWMRVREHEGLSYGIGLGTSAGSLDDFGTVTGGAIVAPQNLAKAKASILDELGKLAAGGTVTDAELAHAKGAWLKSQETDLGSDRFVVAMLVRHLHTRRTAAWTKELRAKIAAVTATDVMRVAKANLHVNRLLVIEAGDQSKAK